MSGCNPALRHPQEAGSNASRAAHSTHRAPTLACCVLPHRVPFFDCVLQGVGNNLPPENWENHSDCCLVKATWREEVPDLVLPRPCRNPPQLIDVGCLKRGQASLAGNSCYAISLPTSHSYTTTIWHSHVHSSTLNDILVVAANLRLQRNLLQVSITENWASDIKAY